MVIYPLERIQGVAKRPFFKRCPTLGNSPCSENPKKDVYQRRVWLAFSYFDMVKNPCIGYTTMNITM